MSNAAAQLDRVFSALASVPRREIVARLAQGPVTTPELRRDFDFSKQALSRHLQVLEDAGLAQRKVHGRLHVVSIGGESLELVSTWIDVRRKAWERSFDRLGEMVAKDKMGPDKE